MSNIKLLSFDLDDTLWPCKPTIDAAEKVHYRWLQKNVPEITAHLSIEQLRDKRSHFLKQHPEFEHDLSLMRLESLKALADEYELDNNWIDEAFDIYYDARQKVTLYDDVTVVLDELKQRYRLVAVTNGNADIDKTGVAHWFEFSVTAADVGFVKPHPAVFESVLSRSRCSADEILHIGDDQHHDVFGASQVGIRSVWLNRSGNDWQHQDCAADFHIKSLIELPGLLADLKV